MVTLTVSLTPQSPPPQLSLFLKHLAGLLPAASSCLFICDLHSLYPCFSLHRLAISAFSVGKGWVSSPSQGHSCLGWEEICFLQPFLVFDHRDQHNTWQTTWMSLIHLIHSIHLLVRGAGNTLVIKIDRVYSLVPLTVRLQKTLKLRPSVLVHS